MTTQEDSKPRGLAAIQDARNKRKIIYRIPPRVFLWVFVVIAVWAIIYWKLDQNELAAWRNRLLARQRAVASELAPRFTPLRDRIEAWTLEAVGDYPGDLVTEQAKTSPFRSKPGVYLRVYIDEAKNVDALRTAAMESLREGFTSCFTTYPNANPFEGPSCKVNGDCKAPLHCNENFHCTVPAQPYNLRVAYRGSRVLYDNWVKEVRDATNDMRLRLLERDFNTAVDDDIPVMIDLMASAQYFLLVIDENAENPKDLPDADTYSESLQAVQHPVRVFAWDLASNKLLFRVRTSVTAQTGMMTPYPITAVALRRQSNNCAIAVYVRRLLGDDSAPDIQLPGAKGLPPNAPSTDSAPPSGSTSAVPLLPSAPSASASAQTPLQ